MRDPSGPPGDYPLEGRNYPFAKDLLEAKLEQHELLAQLPGVVRLVEGARRRLLCIYMLLYGAARTCNRACASMQGEER